MTPLWISAYDEVFRPMVEEFFWPSLERTEDAYRFEFATRVIPNTYGTYGEQKYRESYWTEFQRVLGLLNDNPGRLVVWSDSDICFYRPIVQELKYWAEHYDIGCCRDREETYCGGVVRPRVFCTGLMFFRVTPAVCEFFKRWETRSRGSSGWASPQVSFNQEVEASAGKGFLVGELDRTYWSVGLGLLQRVWEPGDAIANPPAGMRLHHANFTIGVDHKRELLSLVQQKAAQ